MNHLLLFMTCDPHPFNFIYLNAGCIHSVRPALGDLDRAVIIYGGGHSVVVDDTAEDVAARLGMTYEPDPDM